MKREGSSEINRWVCRCTNKEVLLGTYDNAGNVYVSVRKRHYHIVGSVTATCPMCGAVHKLVAKSEASTE